MTLGPSTIRPSARLEAMVERMRRQKLTNLRVTTSDGSAAKARQRACEGPRGSGVQTGEARLQPELELVEVGEGDGASARAGSGGSSAGIRVRPGRAETEPLAGSVVSDSCQITPTHRDQRRAMPTDEVGVVPRTWLPLTASDHYGTECHTGGRRFESCRSGRAVVFVLVGLLGRLAAGSSGQRRKPPRKASSLWPRCTDHRRVRRG